MDDRVAVVFVKIGDDAGFEFVGGGRKSKEIMQVVTDKQVKPRITREAFNEALHGWAGHIGTTDRLLSMKSVA